VNRLTVSATIVSACVMLVPAAGAQGDGVELRIGAVAASNAGQAFDDRLGPMRRQFNALFKYSSYQLVHEERRRIRWGKKAGFELPGGRFLVVIPKESRNDFVSLQLMLISGTRPVVQTGLMLRDKGTFLVGGPRYRDGVLIIAIGAHTNAAPVPTGAKDTITTGAQAGYEPAASGE
jgi:hypothetical protein